MDRINSVISGFRAFRIPKMWINRFRACLGHANQIILLVLPHLMVVAVLIIYLIIGSYVFCMLEGADEAFATPMRHIYNISNVETEVRNESDQFQLEDYNANSTSEIISRLKRNADAHVNVDQMEKKKNENHDVKWNVYDGILFAYSIVTTIGYNDLGPITNFGRAFYVLYAMIGVPLCTLVLMDWSLFVEEFALYLYHSTLIGRYLINRNSRSPVGLELLLMVPLALCFFFLYIIIGAILLRLWESGWTFSDGFYASFDAVTTIGISYIRPSNYQYYPLTLFYVTAGIAVSSTCLTLVVTDLARLVHYSGRTVRDCASTSVYFGSKRIQVCQLLAIVADEWSVDVNKVRELIEIRLDDLINDIIRKRADNDDGNYVGGTNPMRIMQSGL